MKKAQRLLGFFHIQSEISNLPGGVSRVQHCTWLGPEPAAPSGRCRQAERRESQGAAARRDYASSPGVYLQSQTPGSGFSMWLRGQTTA